MNFNGMFGLLDIIIVVGILLFALIGYKKGFSKKIISPLTILIFLGVSFVFCGSLADILSKTNIQNAISGPISSSLEGAEGATYGEVIGNGFNMWSGIADWFGKGVTSKFGEFDATTAQANITSYFTSMALSSICFIVIFIVIIIIALILRGIARSNKKVGFIRFVDGILGLVFYVALFSAIVCCCFYLLGLVIDQEWFKGAKSWLDVDMQLSNTDSFRLSRTIYDGNFIQKIIDLIV